MTRLAALVGCAAVALTTAAYAGNRFCIEPPEPETTRAYQYAAMDDQTCLTELANRAVPFERVAPERARGVALPIRLTGPVHGVSYEQTYRTELDPESPTTFLDCRLALAVDDLSRALAARDVVKVQYLSMYRPGHLKPGVRHPAGRAIDLALVERRDGTIYSVERDFLGRVGAQTCGEGAAPPRRDTDGARFWRSLVCELDGDRTFNLVLSPNYDRGHRDHLHLEVRSDIRWYLTQ